MRVQLLHIDACPGHEPAGRRLRESLDALGLGDVPIDEVLVRSSADAAALPFAGSPTIVVDGEDLFPSPANLLGLACRVYATDAGLADSPTRSQITEALRARM
ncbi:hypothetical protein [Demequina sp.]|uniref:hypothetical protein n=1 Tax=Demequina sp. TaxID=2050685 RepID=UPI0025F2F413|nr:hypothetical protein [Demequina sp.]